jgi:hypothetical protein
VNADTLVVVHCYQGDAPMVEAFLPQYLHHQRPVLILSPADSPVRIEAEGVECRWVGQRGYFGQASLDRQRAHLQVLLEYPYKFYLLNDADSMCLSPEIPSYLFENAEGTLWSTEVKEGRPHPSPYPKLACHPPYFLTRDTIERLLAVWERIPLHPETPFIDYHMMAATCEAGVAHRSYPDGRSFPAWRHSSIPETKELGHDYVHVQEAQGIDGAQRMAAQVQAQGVVFVHSVKHPEVRDQLVAAYERRRPRVLRVPSVPTALANDADLSVLVAFRDDTEDQHRTKLWDVIQGLLASQLPQAEVVVESDDGTPFCKTAALNRAAARASGSVFYILDADSWVPAYQVREAHRWIVNGKAWAKPWNMKYKLGPDATAEILQGGWDGAYRAEWRRGLEHQGGYLPAPPLLVSRAAFEEVGGLDERFNGWGSEDVSFSQSLQALFGKPMMGRGGCVHLHHPRIGRSGNDRWEGQTEEDYARSLALAAEYRRASRTPILMRELIANRKVTAGAG